MEGRRVKTSVIYGLYVIAFMLLLGSIYLVGKGSKETFQTEEIPNTYVSKSIFDHTISVISPVVVPDDTMIKPFANASVEIKKNFYDAKDTEENQKNAIIYYENTYMQSSGIAYGSNEAFDVLSAMKGEVIAVTEDDLLGNVVQIKHENGIITVYESLSNVKVKVGDKIEKGTVIASSGTSNLLPEIEHGLYFEVISDGHNLNPLLCFDRTIAEIKG